MHFEEPTHERLGSYRLERVLGEGAAAVVYFATRDGDGYPVALKVFRQKFMTDPALRRRIVHEARTAAEIRHPNLQAIVDEGESDGQVFLAFEYAAGGSLEDVIRAQPLSVDRTLAIGMDACAGLSALHAAGIIHRDMKPSNIVLRGDGSAAITDFGLVKGKAYTALTSVGRVVGTLAYMAPELISGSAATAATDIYGCSGVLFSCLTGQPPFGSGSTFQVAFAALKSPPPDVREFRSEVPAAMAQLISEGFAKDPNDRPPSAVDFGQRLSAIRASGGAPQTSGAVAV